MKSASDSSTAAASPENDEPCITARVRGRSAARLRIVAPVVGVTAVKRNCCSAAVAGPTIRPR